MEKADRERLIERLQTEYAFKYYQYPEGEAPEDYPKRVLRGQGFAHAMRIVNEVINPNSDAKSKV